MLVVPLDTLKTRSEFLRIRGGARWAGPSFVLETRSRDAAPAVPGVATEAAPEPAPADGQARDPARNPGGPRFGFTVTRKLGSAVVRNRIRRRLKAAVAEVAATGARPGHDYVLIARDAALDRPFADLKKELEAAFHRVHHAPQRRPKPRE